MVGVTAAVLIQVLCFLTGFISTLFWVYRRGYKKKSKIPGMRPSSKEEGNLSDIGQAGSLHEFLSQLHAQYGSIASFWFGQTYTVSIASPELFKQHFQASERPPVLYRLFEPVFGPASLTYANGEDGRARRRHYDRAFGRDRLCTYYEMFQKATDLLVDNWSRKTEADHVPLCEDTFVFAVRAALLTILGEYFHDDGLVQKFRKAYETAWAELERRLGDPVLPSAGSERMTQFDDAIKHMKSTVQQVVQHRKETTAHGTLLIDDIIEHSASEDVVQCDSITFLVASFHTTGNFLAWCLYYLAKHSAIQEKVYNEIVEVLGDKRLVDDSNLDKFKYTCQVIDESLRCGVIGPWAARYMETDFVLGGYNIPKQTPVIHALGVVLQDGQVWSSPEKFDPERFNEENSKTRHPYAFSPFGFAGKKKCPAYKYSYLECTVLLATVLRRFKLSLHKADKPVVPVYGFVTHPAEEIWLRVTTR